MKKWMFFVISLLILSAFVLAVEFDSELKARNYYNQLKEKPRFIQVEIYDINSVLDDTTYKVYWRAKVHDNVGLAGVPLIDFTDVAVFPKTDSAEAIRSQVKLLAQKKVDAWVPPKPTVHHVDHALYGEKMVITK